MSSGTLKHTHPFIENRTRFRSRMVECLLLIRNNEPISTMQVIFISYTSKPASIESESLKSNYQFRMYTNTVRCTHIHV